MLDSLEHLVGGLGTAVLALVAFCTVSIAAALCLAGVGIVLLPVALRVSRAVADRERARLSRWGPEILGPRPVPERLRDIVRDRAVRREVLWSVVHATFGLGLGAVGLSLPVKALQDGSFPLWWPLLPPGVAGDSLGLVYVETLPGALAVSPLGVAWIALAMVAMPGMARLQAWPARRLLTPDPGTDLALRVAQLTATRAAALDAHAAELRRIERALHDGTQNRLVAVTVLLGAARRALARDPAAADAAMERAQGAAEQALAELRAVVRGILPPVLTERSLPEALAGLASSCPVPCRIDAELAVRCAVSVEATAYYVVSEALTNVARHSQARNVTVSLRGHDGHLLVRVTDDGRGGADERDGSGLVGIRRRVEAHDGTLTLASPPGGPTTLEVSLPCGS
jgi:signal transduction histidine kinase